MLAQDSKAGRGPASERSSRLLAVTRIQAGSPERVAVPFAARAAILAVIGSRMSIKSSSKQPSRWTIVVKTARLRVYGLRRTAATVAVGALAVFVGYHAVLGHNGITVFEHKRQDTRSLQVQMQDLQRENDRLRGHVERLRNDPGAIEHQAREELHYTRPGEIIYTLPSDPKATSAPVASKP